MQNTSGNSYKSVYTQKIDAYIADDTAMYLASTAAVNWSEQMMAIKKAEGSQKIFKLIKKNLMLYTIMLLKIIAMIIIKQLQLNPGYMPDIEKFMNQSQVFAMTTVFYLLLC